MDEFLKMDIFFIVSTVAVVVVAGLIAYAVFRVIKILRYVERLTETVSEEAQLIRADIDDARASVKAEGFKWATLMRFARGSVKRFVTKKFTK